MIIRKFSFFFAISIAAVLCPGDLAHSTNSSTREKNQYLHKHVLSKQNEFSKTTLLEIIAFLNSASAKGDFIDQEVGAFFLNKAVYENIGGWQQEHGKACIFKSMEHLLYESQFVSKVVRERIRRIGK